MLQIILYCALITPNMQNKIPKDMQFWVYPIEQMACQEGIDPNIVVAIILQESNFQANKYNKRTHDYGLMQINERTAKALKVPVNMLYNPEYNLKVGIKILAWYKKSYRNTWLCRYNVGTGALIGVKQQNCNNYKSLIYKKLTKE